MARPKNKAELLDLSRHNYDRLLQYIEAFSPDEQQMDFPPGTMNRNVRDVLAHLYHWHLMMMQWYEVGMTGAKPDIPAKGYTWKTIPDLNREIWKKYLQVDLTEAKRLLQDSHDKVMCLVRQHSDEELFEKRRFKWTGTTSLGAYLISATSSHYDWAYKLIKKAKKNA